MKRLALLALMAALILLAPRAAEAGSTLPVPDSPVAVYPIRLWNPLIFRPIPIIRLPLFPF